jgi:hypothetical protein
VKLIRRREVTIQTSETFVLRSSQITCGITCTECASGVAMLTPDAAASLFGVPSRWIYRWIETGQLHFQETPAGSVLVCPNSLQKAVQLHAGNPGSITLNHEEK